MMMMILADLCTLKKSLSQCYAFSFAFLLGYLLIYYPTIAVRFLFCMRYYNTSGSNTSYQGDELACCLAFRLSIIVIILNQFRLLSFCRIPIEMKMLAVILAANWLYLHLHEYYFQNCCFDLFNFILLSLFMCSNITTFYSILFISTLFYFILFRLSMLSMPISCFLVKHTTWFVLVLLNDYFQESVGCFQTFNNSEP